MKALLLDVYKDEVRVVEANTLEDYYNLLDCNFIDVVGRRIGNKYFNIVCDDEGTFRQDCKISAIDNFGGVMLVGNLLICGDVLEGELQDLEDIDYVKRRILKVQTKLHPEGYMMLTQCEY